MTHKAASVDQFFKELPNRLKLDYARQKWPLYLYHFSDITNACSILTSNTLYSRQSLMEQKSPFIDAADAEVIGRTNEKDKRFVRLYFRPQTPTQFSNEGFKPSKPGIPHCPMPIFFLFNAPKIIEREGTIITDGSLARSPNKGSGLPFLETLDFSKIYHNQAMSQEEKSEIINARHSEVLAQEPLDLNLLKLIICRSRAEKATLLSLLPKEIANYWENQIFVEQQRPFFFKKNNFVDNVVLQENQIEVEFSPAENDQNRGPFNIVVSLESKEKEWVREDEGFFIPKEPQKLRFQKLIDEYTFRLTLDGHIAYQGQFRAKKKGIVLR